MIINRRFIDFYNQYIMKSVVFFPEMKNRSLRDMWPYSLNNKFKHQYGRELKVRLNIILTRKLMKPRSSFFVLNPMIPWFPSRGRISTPRILNPMRFSKKTLGYQPQEILKSLQNLKKKILKIKKKSPKTVF